MAHSHPQVLPVHVLATLRRSKDSASAVFAWKMGLLPFDRPSLSQCSLLVSRRQLLGTGRWFVSVESTWAQSSEAKVLTWL
jgi:hypothetical protein